MEAVQCNIKECMLEWREQFTGPLTVSKIVKDANRNKFQKKEKQGKSETNQKDC